MLTVRSRPGLYCFTRMPYGLVESSGILCYLLGKLIQSWQLPEIQHYVDDIFFGAECVDEGLIILEKFMRNIREAGLKLSLQKSKVLGWCIQDGRIAITEQRAQNITKLAFPRSRRQLRKILGVCEFVSSNIPNFSFLVQPFRELLRAPKWKIVQTV